MKMGCVLSLGNASLLTLSSYMEKGLNEFVISNGLGTDIIKTCISNIGKWSLFG